MTDVIGETTPASAGALAGLELIEAGLALLTTADPHTWSGTDAMGIAAGCGTAVARLTAVRSSALCKVSDTGVWGLDGSPIHALGDGPR